MTDTVAEFVLVLAVCALVSSVAMVIWAHFYLEAVRRQLREESRRREVDNLDEAA